MAEESEKNSGEQEPKIIVDDDWKAQAQADKERLAKEVEAEGKGAEAPQASGAGQPREMPRASFASLVSMLVTQILVALGGVEDPQTKRRYLDLNLAKHYIDVLAVLEDKTKNNLTPEEKKLLDQALYETRMRFVELAQRISAS